MPVEEDVRTAREAVEDAIDELHSSGFHRAELSLVCTESLSTNVVVMKSA